MDDLLLFEPQPKLSILAWYLKSLGLRYVIGFLFVTLLSWFLIRLATTRGQQRQFALLVIVPLPALVGFVSVFDGLIGGFGCFGCGGPTWTDYADMFSMSLVGLQVGLWLTLPGFIVSLAILCRQALSHGGLKP